MDLLPLSYVHKTVFAAVLDSAFEVAKDTLPTDIQEEYHSRNLFIFTVALLANIDNGYLMPVFRANLPLPLLSWSERVYTKVHNHFARTTRSLFK